MRRFLVLAMALAWSLGPTAAAPDHPVVPTDDEGLLSELAAIRTSLEHLSQQIAALTAQQELDVLVRRIEVKQDRLIPLEAELREARNEDRRVNQEMEKLDLLETQWQDELSDHRKISTDDETTKQTERQIALLRQRRETLESNAVTNRQRVIELENRLADTRSDIEAVEALLDERLDER